MQYRQHWPQGSQGSRRWLILIHEPHRAFNRIAANRVFSISYVRIYNCRNESRRGWLVSKTQSCRPSSLFNVIAQYLNHPYLFLGDRSVRVNERGLRASSLVFHLRLLISGITARFHFIHLLSSAFIVAYSPLPC